MPVIDIHAHVTPRALIDAKAGLRDLHGLSAADIGRGLGHDVSVEQRLADMDRLGIDVALLSTQGQLYCYDEDLDSVIALHRECNDELAATVSAHPERLAGVAITPMQDAVAAAAELRRAMGDLGLRGAMVGDHVNGVLWDDARFDPFWAEAEELGAIILFHQAPPTLISSRVNRYHLSNTVGNLVERTVSFASLVFGGVLDRFPGLKLVLCHGGGYTCYAVGRLDWGWQWRESARVNTQRPPSEYLRSFYYDCITHNEAALRFLIDQVGADHVLLGTDYPGYAAGKEGAAYDPVAWLRELGSVSDEEKNAILSGNAVQLLGLGPR